jgi:hypothetical protein
LVDGTRVVELAVDIAGAEEGDGFAETEGHEKQGAGKCGKSHTVNDNCAELVSESAIDLEFFGVGFTNILPSYNHNELLVSWDHFQIKHHSNAGGQSQSPWNQHSCLWLLLPGTAGEGEGH